MRSIRGTHPSKSASLLRPCCVPWPHKTRLKRGFVTSGRPSDGNPKNPKTGGTGPLRCVPVASLGRIKQGSNEVSELCSVLLVSKLDAQPSGISGLPARGAELDRPRRELVLRAWRVA